MKTTDNEQKLFLRKKIKEIWLVTSSYSESIYYC